MIQRLTIRNYVLIDHLDVRFDQGLTIITGETGAGKSILLGALGLILGDRAESGVLADEQTKAVVEGTFRIGDAGLKGFFEDHDLEYDDILILRREILPQGRSRAFINDSPASLQVMKELGRRLIDIHQQFDQLDVLDEGFQLRMLDALAGQQSIREDYIRAYREWKAVEARLRERIEAASAGDREREFLTFQIQELETANLLPAEDLTLEEEAGTLRHAAGILQALDQGRGILEGDNGSVPESLRQLERSLTAFRNVHPVLASLADRLDGLLIELDDLGREMSALSDEITADPHRLSAVEERMSLINRLLLKHQAPGVDELLRKRDSLKARMSGLDSSREEIRELEARLREQEDRVRSLATTLTSGRKAAAGPFLEGMQSRLADLGMGGIRLDLRIEDLPEPGALGADRPVFRMAQGEGDRWTPVRQAASGGEISRLTLVMKSLVARAIPLPTLVFDEIDSGVSGSVSMKMGDLLTAMAEGHQLLVITHSPQIAAKAHGHLLVSKESGAGHVRTRVSPLTGEDRIRAIAVMLSTDPPSEAALANARELAGGVSS